MFQMPRPRVEVFMAGRPISTKRNSGPRRPQVPSELCLKGLYQAGQCLGGGSGGRDGQGQEKKQKR